MTAPYSLSQWDLSDLFADTGEAALEAAFAELEQKASEFEKIRPKLEQPVSIEDLMEIIHQVEDASRLAHRLHSLASLRFAEDTQNQTAQVFLAKVEEFMAHLQNRTLFFDLWFKGLPDEEASELMAGAGPNRYWLEAMRLFKPYTLTEAEEKIINLKDVTGASALTSLYDAITNRYTFSIEVDGETKIMTRSGLMVYAQHHDPDLRERAYQELYRVYGQDAPILGQIYQALVRDWRNEHVGLRGQSSPMSVRNLANDLSDQVVDTLLEVCRENAPLFERFFRIKAARLGLEKLRRYDLYAPVVKSDKSYDFSQAVDMVFRAYANFDPRLAELAERVFKAGHVDSEDRPGKMGGAFCASTLPELTPFVLINYLGRARDVATLAHELGHAVHSLLAADKTLFTFHATLPLAETASTFGEMLLLDLLLEQEDDEEVRRDLLFRQIDDAYATIMRQAYFALFERQAHEMIREGRTVDEISAAYTENLGRQFGDAVELSDEFRFEWVSIPHFYHTPFYVYAYSFGQLLVLSLYRQYKADPQDFIPRYFGILSSGGSDSPGNILSRAGLHVDRAEFWEGGFGVLKDLIDRLEEIG